MNNNIKEIFAKNVRKFRKQKKISQETMSLELNLDISYMGKIENAKMNFTIDKAIAIANFLEVDLISLFKN